MEEHECIICENTANEKVKFYDVYICNNPDCKKIFVEIAKEILMK